LLEQIQAFFCVGTVTSRKTRNTAVYEVQSFEELTKVIIPHFDKYPLITQKQADFILFKSIMESLNRKEQSTTEGLQKIINIRASINTGLSIVLKKTFPNTIPVIRPNVNFEGVPDPF
jgi:competence protein ComGF